MPLLAWCTNSRSALPSGCVLLSVRTVALGESCGFMWKRALWLAAKHTGSTLLTGSLAPVSAHLDSEKEN